MMMPIRKTGLGRLGDQSIQDIITQAAQSQGVPPPLALAQAQQESGLNPNATGAKGEQGLFQLMPEYFAQNGNLFDPTVNSNVALAYLAQQYQTTGNWRDALISYNEGPTAFAEGHRYASSQSYADGILAAAGIAGGGGGTTTTVTQAPPAPSNPGTGTQSPGQGTDWTTIALIGVGALVLTEVLT